MQKELGGVGPPLSGKSISLNSHCPKYTVLFLPALFGILRMMTLRKVKGKTHPIAQQSPPLLATCGVLFV